MPSHTGARNVLAAHSWRRTKPSRNSSTAQELRTFRDGEQTSAMLHGKAKKETQSGPNHESFRHTQQPLPSSQNHKVAQRSEHVHRRILAQQNQPKKQPNIGKKRKAGAPAENRPARRQRRDDTSNSRPPLKDEAHIRSTMQVPTPKEYPDMPSSVFKNAKHAICEAASGLAELHTESTQMAKAAYQCTLHYKSAARTDVVSAEGLSKVMFLLVHFLLVLNVYRTLPRLQRTSTCCACSMSTAYSQKSWTETLVSINSISSPRNRP